MALFAYKAAAADGQLLEGRMEAADRDAVVQRLQSQGHVPIRAEEVQSAPLVSGSRIPLAMSRRGARVDVQVLTTELSTLLNAGLPLDRALELLRDLSVADIVFHCDAVSQHFLGARPAGTNRCVLSFNVFFLHVLMLLFQVESKPSDIARRCHRPVGEAPGRVLAVA